MKNEETAPWDWEDYAVTYNGEVKYFINRSLVESQGVEDELMNLITLHQKKLCYLERMQAAGDIGDIRVLRYYAAEMIQVEFALQDKWGFQVNSNYHKFWHLPHCSCPTLDNEDRYPSGWYVKNQDCLVHGVEM